MVLHSPARRSQVHHDPNGNLTSTGGPKEFMVDVYNLTVEHTSVGGDVFTNDIVLNLTDTLIPATQQRKK